MFRSGPDTFVNRECPCNSRQAHDSTRPLFLATGASPTASAHRSDTFGTLVALRETFCHRSGPQTHVAPLPMMPLVVGLCFRLTSWRKFPRPGIPYSSGGVATSFTPSRVQFLSKYLTFRMFNSRARNSLRPACCAGAARFRIRARCSGYGRMATPGPFIPSRSFGDVDHLLDYAPLNTDLGFKPINVAPLECKRHKERGLTRVSQCGERGFGSASQNGEDRSRAATGRPG